MGESGKKLQKVVVPPKKEAKELPIKFKMYYFEPKTQTWIETAILDQNRMLAFIDPAQKTVYVWRGRQTPLNEFRDGERELFKRKIQYPQVKFRLLHPKMKWKEPEISESVQKALKKIWI